GGGRWGSCGRGSRFGNSSGNPVRGGFAMTLHRTACTRRDFLRLGAAAAALGPGFLRAADADDKPPDLLIGYTEFRTDLPGGRYVNVATRRVVLIKADGTGRRVLAEEVTREKGSWTQFVGWSPAGKTAILGRGWESEENGKWEEEHKTFRHGDGWLVDGYLLDLATGKATNVTGVGRVSHFNEGLAFMPGDPTKLRFSAMTGGKTRQYLMDLDG